MNDDRNKPNLTVGYTSFSLFSILLTILFIGLKFTGYIKWSWIWVLSPIWITWILSILFLIVFYIIFTRWR